MKNETTVSRVLAPEDIREGDYLCKLHVVYEHLPLFCIVEAWEEPRIHRIRYLPGKIAPMKVIEVCLPFVLIEKTDGTHAMIDVRRYGLARVSERFGKKAFKRAKKHAAEKAEDKEGDE